MFPFPFLLGGLCFGYIHTIPSGFYFDVIFRGNAVTSAIAKRFIKKYWNICSNILFLLECNFASMYKLDVLFRVAKNREYIYVINYLDL